MKRFLFFLFPLPLFAFVIDPYFTPIGEVELRSAYSHRYYPSIDRSIHPSSYSSHDQLIDLNLGANFWPNWDLQFQFDFSHTHRLNWGGQRLGTQLRYLMWNDVAGDPVSLSVGGQIFYVPTRNMRDVSSLYHSQGNLELGAAVGKEISRDYRWLWRFWGFVGAGIANRGYPWLRPVFTVEGKLQICHKLKLSVEGYFGFGNRPYVDVDAFNGYAKVQHRSVDIGISYTYLFKIWGALGIKYAFRLYAHAFPEHASTFRVEYRFPFSLL